MAILYLETNFVVGAARGQDRDADALLGVPSSALRLVMPSVCVMETLSREEGLAGTHTRFELQAKSYINDLKGNVSSPSAKAVTSALEQSISARAALLNETRENFNAVLTKLVSGPDGTSRVELIALTTGVLATWLAGEIVLREPTDALILDIVLDHARRYRDEAKGFLSANKTDFDTPEVKHALRRSGITHYFKETGHALGWVRAGCRP
jgi:hypothetical protein